MKNKKHLQYFIDKEANVLYFTQGEPSAKDISKEISDGVIGRFDPKTKELKGFTIINFSKRSKTELPISVDFSLAK